MIDINKLSRESKDILIIEGTLDRCVRLGFLNNVGAEVKITNKGRDVYKQLLKNQYRPSEVYLEYYLVNIKKIDDRNIEELIKTVWVGEDNYPVLESEN